MKVGLGMSEGILPSTDFAHSIPDHQGYIFPSQVQKVAAPSSSFGAVTLPPSSSPPFPLLAITFSMHEILSCGLMIPSTSQSTLTFAAISVVTSPGCTASTTGASMPLLRYSSADKWRSPWLRAAFEAAYAPKPSSKERKLAVEPESEDMKTIVLILIGVAGEADERDGDGTSASEGEESLSRC